MRLFRLGRAFRLVAEIEARYPLLGVDEAERRLTAILRAQEQGDSATVAMLVQGVAS